MTKKSRQQRIIRNYYENRDRIMIQNLGELVTELVIAESPARRDQLWVRVEKALRNLNVKEEEIARLTGDRSPEKLARFVQERF